MQREENDVAVEQFLQEHNLLLAAVAKIGYRRRGRGYLIIADAHIEGFPSEGKWPLYLPLSGVVETVRMGGSEVLLEMVEQYDPESTGLVMCLGYLAEVHDE